MPMEAEEARQQYRKTTQNNAGSKRTMAGAEV